MMVLTERDAVALAGLRERLAEVADAGTGGDASRTVRNRVCDLLFDIDSAFDHDLGRCHADTMPDVKHDKRVGWTIRCFSCGSWVTRETFSEAEEAWNESVERFIEEGSE